MKVMHNHALTEYCTDACPVYIAARTKSCGTCGHDQTTHIYYEGACRPGFVCPCDEFVPQRPALTTQQEDQLAAIRRSAARRRSPVTPSSGECDCDPHVSWCMDCQYDALQLVLSERERERDALLAENEHLTRIADRALELLQSGTVRDSAMESLQRGRPGFN